MEYDVPSAENLDGRQDARELLDLLKRMKCSNSSVMVVDKWIGVCLSKANGSTIDVLQQSPADHGFGAFIPFVLTRFRSSRRILAGSRSKVFAPENL